jgi:hypothetical protein
MKNQRGGRGGRGGVSRGAADNSGNWRDTSRQTDQRGPKQDSQAPRAPQANRTGGQPRLPAETKAPPQPFNVREVTEFLSSRYTSAHEDHKRATASSNSGEKKKNGETQPAVVLYQAEGGAWGPLSKPMAPGTDDFLSTLENALRVFERDNSAAGAGS